jgi:hypothetical protein
MNKGRVGEERGGKETDRCPLTVNVGVISEWLPPWLSNG